MRHLLSPRFTAFLAIFLILATARHVLGDERRLDASAAPAQPPTGIVDLHCHTAGIGAGGSGCFVSDELRHNFRFGPFLRGFGVNVKDLEANGDAVVIDRIAAQIADSKQVARAVVLALDGVVDASGELDRRRTEMYVPNEFVAREVARHPNLLFGASVNPHRVDAVERLEWAKANGAVLVKWLPSIQHIDPADARLVPFYRRMAELGLPLLTHTGTERSFTEANDALCDPERLRLALDNGVVVIAAHAATKGKYNGEPAIERLARLMRTYPNLYADTSSLTQINKRSHLRRVLDRPEFRRRLVYGTDYPLTAMRMIVSPWYYPFRLSWRQKREIAALSNTWDHDVALKHALGMPAEAWTTGEKLLGLPSRTTRSN